MVTSAFKLLDLPPHDGFLSRQTQISALGFECHVVPLHRLRTLLSGAGATEWLEECQVPLKSAKN
jgi:hypothetical protein